MTTPGLAVKDSAVSEFLDVPEGEEAPANDAIELVGDGPAYKLKRIQFPLLLPCGGYVDQTAAHSEVELHHTTGVEEDLFADESLDPKQTMNRLLENCITRIGSHEFKYGDSSRETRAKREKIVQGLLLGDRAFMIVALRWISLREKNIHKFVSICENKKCQADSTHTVDLSDLIVSPMAEPTRRIFTCTLDDGRVVRYRHLAVSDEPTIETLAKKAGDKFVSAMLWLRLQDIDGKKVGSYRDLQSMATFDRETIREHMDSTDGGIDLNLTVQCPKCSLIKRTPLDISAGFFLQSFIGAKRRRATEG